MKESEFDQFANEYRGMHASNIKASGEKPEFFAEYKVRDVASRIKTLGLKSDVILDFGSGVGNSIPHFRNFMPKSVLVCADVSSKSLEISEQRFPGSAHLHHIENDSLSSMSLRFDVLFSACVFHHIPRGEHIYWLKELRSVANPGAMLALFEHNPWNPLTLRAVNTCPFDVNAELLSASRLRSVVKAAGWHDVKTEFRIFFPGKLARLRPAERFLTWLPIGAQHVVYARA